MPVIKQFDRSFFKFNWTLGSEQEEASESCNLTLNSVASAPACLQIKLDGAGMGLLLNLWHALASFDRRPSRSPKALAGK